jgi:hypothetical protein
VLAGADLPAPPRAVGGALVFAGAVERYLLGADPGPGLVMVVLAAAAVAAAARAAAPS